MNQYEQPPTYALKEHGEDYRRLIRMARQYAKEAREGWNRAGLGLGDRVIDVGCGPIGALLSLAETVGVSGTVVGLDYSQSALDIAKRILLDANIKNAHLIRADINELSVKELCPPGPFDAAYCRLVLVHQADPSATLRQMASLVRSGGHIIVQEWLFDPLYPVFDPPLPFVERLERLVGEAMRRSGAYLDVARHFTELCDATGLKEVSQRGFFEAGPSHANVFLEYQAYGTLLAIKDSILSHRLATESEITDLLVEINNAKTKSYRSYFGLPFVELVAQVQ